MGSIAYLKSMVDLQPYTCYPTLIPRIMPDGWLLYPCRPMEKDDGEPRYTANGGVFETGVGAREPTEEIMEAEMFNVSALYLKNSDGVGLENRQPIKAKPLKKASIDKAKPVVNRIVIQVSNGNGVNRMARNVGKYLSSNGFRTMYLTNANHFNHPDTTIYYRSGYLQEARKAAQKLPGRQKMKEVSHLEWESAKVKVVIGKDLIPHMSLFQKAESSCGLTKTTI